MKAKIINLGYQGSGITTLNKALEQMGYKVWNDLLPVFPDMLDDHLSPVIKKMSNYQVFSGLPWSNHYHSLQSLFEEENIKFILSVRNPEEWYESVKKAHKQYSHPVLKHLFKGRSASKKSTKKALIKEYKEHNISIMDQFSEDSEKLLILEYGKHHNWDRLCEFLNEKKPNKLFPKLKDDFKKSSKFNIFSNRIMNKFSL